MSQSISLRDLMTVKNALERLAQMTRHVKLSYAIAKNLAKLRSEAEAIQQAAKPSEEFAKFDQKRAEIAVKHAGKDKEGKPLIVNGNYAIKDREAFDKEIAALRDENAQAITEREQQLAEVEKLLDKETTFEFHKIPEGILSQVGVFTEKADGLGLILEPLLGRVIDLED